MRWAMPQPCMGSRAMVLRIDRSNVTWTKSVGLLIHPRQLSTVQYVLPLLLSIVKGRFSDLAVFLDGLTCSDALVVFLAKRRRDEEHESASDSREFGCDPGDR